MRKSQLHQFFIFTIGSMISVLFSNTLEASQRVNIVQYELAISFDLQTNTLRGTAHLIIPPEKGFSLSIREVKPTGIVLQRMGQPPSSIQPGDDGLIHLASFVHEQEVFLSYSKSVSKTSDNIITKDGISLLHSWYPHPLEDVIFSLTAELPDGFSAVAESDKLPAPRSNPARFSFSHETDLLHFCAAPFAVDSVEVRQGLKIFTYFSQQNSPLATGYLRAAQKFISLYEDMIGPYPYNHFAIVENQRPTGYGMPTFTLLGKNVIPLPFIKDISLGHEILHSWFGNNIEVNTNSGNWSEGLTSYLADWYYREEKGEGEINRKDNISKYLSIVNSENAINLALFRSSSHQQNNARAVRSVGYIRGAMFFHELRTFLGDTDFFEGIREFSRRFGGKDAGWSDMQAVFEQTTATTLETFFKARLSTTEIPDISISNIRISSSAGKHLLHFTTELNMAQAYDVILPMRVVHATGSTIHHERIVSNKQEVEVSLDLPPIDLIVDPGYDLLRQLGDTEKEPVLSSFFGSNQVTAIVTDDNREKYAPLLKSLNGEHLQIPNYSDIHHGDLANSNLLFLGGDNEIVRSLFGAPPLLGNGFTIDIRHNPLNRKFMAALVSAKDYSAVTGVAHKLNHYGKYSHLHFQGGRLVEKETTRKQMGLRYQLGSAPTAFAATQQLDLPRLIEKLKESRVIYISETHTSMTDHYLQHLVLRALYENNSNITIAMEMFPKRVQQTLDDYTLSKVIDDEKEFLKKSEYFKVWKFDYRYYKNIIDFARQHSLPLIGLNIDREIVSTVFKSGSLDGLNEDERKQLPLNMNLDIPGYYHRLKETHGLHSKRGHGEGKFSGFIQAQAIWDEVMAKNIAEYLQKHPDSKVIVIAGAQHTRKDNGIPPRVAERIDVQQTVLSSMPEPGSSLQGQADYYITVEPQYLTAAGKIGITLIEDNRGLTIGGLSPHSKAKESGLQAGDRVKSINGSPISTMEDIQISMIGLLPGTFLDLEIERSEGGASTTRKFKIELYEPPPPSWQKGHLRHP